MKDLPNPKSVRPVVRPEDINIEGHNSRQGAEAMSLLCNIVAAYYSEFKADFYDATRIPFCNYSDGGVKFCARMRKPPTREELLEALRYQIAEDCCIDLSDERYTRGQIKEMADAILVDRLTAWINEGAMHCDPPYRIEKNEDGTYSTVALPRDEA